jgi:hypothetical protein
MGLNINHNAQFYGYQSQPVYPNNFFQQNQINPQTNQIFMQQIKLIFTMISDQNK